MSTTERRVLEDSLIREIRYFIAGAILFNQTVADRFHLRLTDMQCLNILELLGPVTPGKLADWTGLSTGGVTVMLDRLEKGGLIRREPNPADRRSILIRINTNKMKKVEPVYAEINARMDALMSAMPQTDLECVLAFFLRTNAIRTEHVEKKQTPRS